MPAPARRRPARDDLVFDTGLRTGMVNVVANATGAVLVFVYLRFVLPPPVVADPERALVVNLVAAVVVLPVGLVLGALLNTRHLLPLRAWLAGGARPGAMRDRALRYPLFATQVNGSLWLLAIVLFGAINLPLSTELGRNVAVTILLGGVATCALCYLLLERQVRPLAAAALTHGMPERATDAGIRLRLAVAWALSAALPLFGIGIVVLLPVETVPARVTVSVLFLVVLGLFVGLLAVRAAASAVAEPIGDLRRAVAQVGDGDLDASVQVYDGSEIGRLQAGFNDMVSGLRERERLRDLFGRQVGPEVAALALREGVSLGGERRTVGVLFVDVIGSTPMALAVEPEEVVRRLNDFFAVVIATVDAYGGSVNKFEGDAALCLFGAPQEVGDPATAALAAARDLAVRLVESMDLRAAIGVSHGSVVAGNVGAETRYEYTVIGDPVNEAARLSDLAKGGGRIVASGSAIDAASDEERSWWRQTGEQVVRGRDTPTRLHVPAR